MIPPGVGAQDSVWGASLGRGLRWPRYTFLAGDFNDQLEANVDGGYGQREFGEVSGVLDGRRPW